MIGGIGAIESASSEARHHRSGCEDVPQAEGLHVVTGEEFRSLPPLPNIPMVVLVAGKHDNIPLEMKRVVGRQRMEHFMKLGSEVSDGALVMTARSDHGIQFSEPELVTWAIKRVLHL